jgi:hypothetical protein
VSDERKWVTEKFGKGVVGEKLRSGNRLYPNLTGFSEAGAARRVGLRVPSRAGREARLRAEEIGWAAEQMRAGGRFGVERPGSLKGRGVYRASLALHGRVGGPARA